MTLWRLITWIVAIPTVMADVNIILTHDDATVTNVCSTVESLALN